MRYVIQNCNVLYFNPDKTAICNDLNLECPCYCKERADCLLKQIVELCKEPKVINCIIDGKEQVFKAYHHTHLGDKILKLLDIQECE